jgi:arylsulfatase A-like enzyme
MRYILFGLIFPFLGIATASDGATPAPRGKAHHVIVMVWDGMRPDFVSANYTPNLWKLVQLGVTFRHHHPVYTASTEVNGTAMATGDYPEHSGLMANREYRPAVNPLGPVGMELPTTIAGEKGPYLAVPSVVETLQAAGLPTAVAGSKGVALLQDWSHNGKTTAAKKSVVFFDGQTAPAAAMAALTGTLGDWPVTIEFPNIPQDTWTTQALIQVLWKDGLPAYSMLWMSDPDYSQHQMAPGSEMALAAIKSVDDRLGMVLDALDKNGWRDDTDIFVVSDHGFSTIRSANDPVAPLAAKGLRITGTSFGAPPKPGDVLAVGNGGSISFYVTGHDKGIGRTITNYLQTTDYAGVIFSRWGLPGTFPLHAAHIATAQAPDVVLAMGWSADHNIYGVPGMVDGDGGRKKGKGTHASLSPYEMHNTLIAAGPDFKQSWEDDTPSGNIDLAPTILWILGVQKLAPIDGRVLLEAMPGHTLDRKVSSQVIVAKNPADNWEEYLKVSRVGTTEYIDEGNRGEGPEVPIPTPVLGTPQAAYMDWK